MAKITLEDGTIMNGEIIEFEEVNEVDELLAKSDELLEHSECEHNEKKVGGITRIKPCEE